MRLYILIIIILALLYLFTISKRRTKKESADILVGQSLVIRAVNKNRHDCIGSPIGKPYKELKCKTSLPARVGDIRVVGAYKNGIYYLY